MNLDKISLKHFPSCLNSPYILSVDAISANGEKSYFSNYGMSAVYIKSGTSMATAFVTGSVGLLKAYSDKKHKG